MQLNQQIDDKLIQPLISDTLGALRNLDYDVAVRNVQMNKRDRYLYGDGLWEQLVIPDGFDKTKYNFLPRVIDIHTSQLMGRGFTVQSWYNKDDISIYGPDQDDQLKSAELTNKERKVQADARKRLVDAMIRDNGGYELFKNGARVGSAYGDTVYKMYWDDTKQKVQIKLLEAPQNVRLGWNADDFREWDFAAYVYQISVDSAYKQYGSVLGEGADFSLSQQGYPLNNAIGDVKTSDPLDQQTAALYPVQTQRKMVTVVDLSGVITGWGLVDGKVQRVKRGEEQELSILIVGGHLVQLITDPDYIPQYYHIRNRQTPRRAWGESDLPDSALDINATYMERMSDYLTIANKTLFPLVMAKGFEMGSIPKRKQREMAVIPMAPEQTLEVVNLPASFGFEYEKILGELKESLVRVTGISRPMFDDPTLNPNSNAGLMTLMKSLVDIVEDKQSRWEPVLTQMFDDALKLAARHVKSIKDVVDTDDDWYFYIQWPNVLRKEDPTFQTMVINNYHAGFMSLDTAMEQLGTPDVTEEMDRLRDEMKDPVKAAIRANLTHQLALWTLYESKGMPPWGVNLPKVSVRADMTPQQEGNMAQTLGWNEGPFGSSIGPQGREGQAANDNMIDQGFIQGNPFDGGLPSGVVPGQALQPNQPPQSQMQPQQPMAGGAPGAAAAPILTAANNQPGMQPMSMPGSGATTQSTAGAVKARNQHRGK